MTDAARGLLISGDQIDPANPAHAAELARICRPHDRRDDAGAGPDPRRQGIVAAMAASPVSLTLGSFDALDQTVTLRQVAVETLIKLNTGQIDADYFDPGAGQIHPRLGGTFYDTQASGPPPFDGPHWSNDPWWQTSDLADPWNAEFDQIASTTASDALSQIEPFRGECAGALQIAVLTGARAALGDDAFNAQHPSGSLSVVPWADVKMYLTVVDVTVPPIPGDYFYFKNKDDYTTYAPNGFWQGLNSLYMGADRLMTARYTGLGAVFQAETELRATMANAYAGDCYPHRVTDPATDIRFTVHAQLVLPDAAKPPAAKAPRAVAAVPGAAPSAAHLGSLGFVETTPGVFQHAAIRMADLSAGLNLGAGSLAQSWSAPLVNPAHRVRLASGAVCIVQPTDPGRVPHDSDTVVRAAIRLTAPT